MLLVKCKTCGKDKPPDHHGLVCKECRSKRAGSSPLYCVKCGSLAYRRSPSLCGACEATMEDVERYRLLIDEVHNFPWDKLEETLAPLVEEFGLTSILYVLENVTGNNIQVIESGQVVVEGD